jgi:hypothetical protein
LGVDEDRLRRRRGLIDGDRSLRLKTWRRRCFDCQRLVFRGRRFIDDQWLQNFGRNNNRLDRSRLFDGSELLFGRRFDFYRGDSGHRDRRGRFDHWLWFK